MRVRAIPASRPGAQDGRDVPGDGHGRRVLRHDTPNGRRAGDGQLRFGRLIWVERAGQSFLQRLQMYCHDCSTFRQLSAILVAVAYSVFADSGSKSGYQVYAGC